MTTNYGIYLILTPKDALSILRQLYENESDSKIEVCVEMFNQRKEFTLREFCERLGIEYI